MDYHKFLLPALSAYPRVGLYVQYKTLGYFLNTLTRLVRSLYNGNIGGEFIDIMSNLITGQIIDAHVKAWNAEGTGGDPPSYLRINAERIVGEQIAHVPGFYRDIVDARVNQTGAEQFSPRIDMWANRYNEAYNDAVKLISEESGGKLEWVYSPEKEHCDTCQRLNGMVAYATEWTISGFAPQNAPNNMLDCGGWQCGCELRPTNKRRSPKALDTLMNIALTR